MERKIGEEFEYKGQKFVVKKASNGCRGCAFKGDNRWDCKMVQTRFGSCLSTNRSEEISVIFAYANLPDTSVLPPPSEKESAQKSDNVNHPVHYNSHPSGIECIEVIRHYDFNIGCAIKYLWRNGLKHEEGMSDKEKQIEDLKKALFYINDEIKMLEGKQ